MKRSHYVNFGSKAVAEYTGRGVFACVRTHESWTLLMSLLQKKRICSMTCDKSKMNTNCPFGSKNVW